ncbi:hypothetical protein O3M35_002498 [Rhynocoris fuscipes]|uniref:Uncharacterized protein n=1 Tax=Rhynocoris fuscipes TaxID=488301 RepID=A0AAW1CSB8_9HEMI
MEKERVTKNIKVGCRISVRSESIVNRGSLEELKWRLRNDYKDVERENTYRNAEKLLSAAEELAQTGECNAQEIYSVAQELEGHVTSFAGRVEQRRRRLDLAVLFYTHEKESLVDENDDPDEANDPD